MKTLTGILHPLIYGMECPYCKGGDGLRDPTGSRHWTAETIEPGSIVICDECKREVKVPKIRKGN